MPISKDRTTLYLSKSDKYLMKSRATQINKTMSEYISELLMWDNRFRLIEHARGGTLDIKEAVEYALSESEE